MSVHRKSAILTLSVILGLGGMNAWAIPNTDIPPDPINASPQGRDPDIKEYDSPILQTRRLSKYAQALGAGAWIGSLAANGSSDSVSYFRYEQTYYDRAMFAHEYSLMFTSNSMIGFNAGFKKLIELNSHYEPYMKIAAGALYQPSESFATLINFQRYQLTGEIGLEDLLRCRRSLRIEVGVTWSSQGLSEFAGMLYAY